MANLGFKGIFPTEKQNYTILTWHWNLNEAQYSVQARGTL